VRGNRKAGQEIRFEALAPLNGGQLEVRKTFLIAADGGTLEVRWNLRARSAGVRLRLVAETLFCLLAGNAPDRYVLWEDDDGVPRRDILASHGEMHAQSVTARVRLVDEWIGFRATVTALGGPKLAAPVSLWRDAIETVSQSEGGYERVYQGTVVAPVWDVNLADGETVECGLRIEFEEGTTHGQQIA
jgi:alpha-amylase